MSRKTDSILVSFEVGNGFENCPAVLRAGNEGVGAFALLALWSARSPTPGAIPATVAERYGSHIPPLLISAGLWTAHDDGYVMVPSCYWRFRVLRRRAAILAHLRDRIYRRDGYKCVYCGSTEDLTLDHVYPKSLGGPDSEENLQTLCRSCNSSKGASVLCHGFASMISTRFTAR